MIEILTTVDFDRWLQKLRDRQARLRMLSRLDRVRFGNFGDVKNVGHGVGEMRFSFGPGYRIYFSRRGDAVLLLLCGGDKSTQAEDIAEAHRLADQWRREEEIHE